MTTQSSLDALLNLMLESKKEAATSTPTALSSLTKLLLVVGLMALLEHTELITASSFGRLRMPIRAESLLSALHPTTSLYALEAWKEKSVFGKSDPESWSLILRSTQAK